MNAGRTLAFLWAVTQLALLLRFAGLLVADKLFRRHVSWVLDRLWSRTQPPFTVTSRHIAWTWSDGSFGCTCGATDQRDCLVRGHL